MAEKTIIFSKKKKKKKKKKKNMKKIFFFVIFGAYGRVWIGAYGRVNFGEFSDETGGIMEVIFMRLEEVLKQNYMGFILSLRDDEEKRYDHFEWFAKGRFEEVFDIVKRLAVHDAMLEFHKTWKRDDINFFLEIGKVNAIELDVISHFNTENVNIILDSEETDFVLMRDYVRKSFALRLRYLWKEMDREYESMLKVKREKERKVRQWQARMAIETIEDGKHDVLYGGTERQIKEAYYEYYYSNYNNS